MVRVHSGLPFKQFRDSLGREGGSNQAVFKCWPRMPAMIAARVRVLCLYRRAYPLLFAWSKLG